MIKIKKIGQGTYGKVYATRERESHTNHAIKRNLVDRELDFSSSIRELDLLTTLKGHPHIAELESLTIGSPFISGAFSPIRSRKYKDDKIHFVFPLADGDLYDLLGSGKINLAKAKQFSVQIALAVEFMHAKNIMHRDIKPKNILNYNGIMKICDFGLSKPYSRSDVQSPKVVTVDYRSPELVMGYKDYDNKIDVWSVGCVIYELFARKSFIYSRSENNRAILQCITSALPERVPDLVYNSMMEKGTIKKFKRIENSQRIPWDKQLFGYNCPKKFDVSGLIDVISHMLEFDPVNRWSITQVLNHSFFQEYSDYIKEVREKFKPEPDPLPIINCIVCNERNWAFQLACDFFNDRLEYDWYKHRILFQSLDIYDRYLEFLNMSTIKKFKQNKSQGLFMNRYRAQLTYLVCLYIAVKYFSAFDYPISFLEIVGEDSNYNKVYKIADEIENKLIKILGHRIYRPTVYDVAEYPLSDEEVVDLLRVVGSLQDLKISLDIGEVYEAFKLAQEEKLSIGIKETSTSKVDEEIKETEPSVITKAVKANDDANVDN